MKKIASPILLLTGLPITKNTQAKSKAPLLGSSDLTTGRYEIAFDRTKINKLEAQNIVVTVKGDSAGINEVIKRINHQKLNGLIANNDR